MDHPAIPVVAVRDTKDLDAARKALESAEGPVCLRIAREPLAVVQRLAGEGELWAEVEHADADEALDLAVAGAQRVILSWSKVDRDTMAEVGEALGPTLLVSTSRAEPPVLDAVRAWGSGLLLAHEEDTQGVEAYLLKGDRIETLVGPAEPGDGDE